MRAAKRFRVVQPWGKDLATESTVVSTHDNAVDAYGEIDRMPCPDCQDPNQRPEMPKGWRSYIEPSRNNRLRAVKKQ